MKMHIVCGLSIVLMACSQPQPRADEVANTPSTHATTTVPLLSPRPGLYTAGQPAAADWNVIAGKGVTTVINLRPDSEMNGRDESAEVKAAGMRYIEIPVANADAITPDNARKLHEAIGSANGKPVLVHCASANRAGGLLALAMVTEHGMTPEQALEFGRKAGMKSTEAAVRKALEAAGHPVPTK